MQGKRVHDLFGASENIRLTYINWSAHFIQTSLGFTSSPLLSQDPIQEISLHLFAFPEALFGCERFSDFLIFDDHKGFEKYWSGNVPQLGFVWCFSHDEARVMDLEEDFHRGKVSFSSSPMRNKSYHGSCNTSSPCPLSPCLLAPVTLNHLTKLVFIRFPNSTVTFSLFPHHTPRKEVTMSSPHLRIRDYLCTLFEVLLHGGLIYSLQFM